MPKCVKCGSDTQLHDSGVPICLECLETRDAATQDRKTPNPDVPESKIQEAC